MNGSCGEPVQPRGDVNDGDSGKCCWQDGESKEAGAASHWFTRLSAPSTTTSSKASGGVGNARSPTSAPATKLSNGGERAKEKSKNAGCVNSGADRSQTADDQDAPASTGASIHVMGVERKMDHASEAADECVGSESAVMTGVKGDNSWVVGVPELAESSDELIESGGKSTDGVVKPEETLAGGLGGKTIDRCDLSRFDDLASPAFLREVAG